MSVFESMAQELSETTMEFIKKDVQPCRGEAQVAVDSMGVKLKAGT